MWLTVNHFKSYSANELAFLFYDLFDSLLLSFLKKTLILIFFSVIFNPDKDFSIWNKDNQLNKFPNFSVSKREFERDLISGGRKSFLGFFSEREKWDLTDDGRRGHFI